MHKYFVLIAILLCSSILVSCSDHESGYYDGYASVEQRKWLALGKKDYDKGYQEGQMQAFQDDWYAENLAEMDFNMSCPVVVMRASPVVFTESGRPIPFK